MAIQVINQRLSAIEPNYADDVTVDMDSNKIREYITDIIKPIYTPLSVQHPVEIRDDKGNIISNDTIVDTFLACCNDTSDPAAETFMKELWSKTLASFGKGLNASSVFIAQANGYTKAILPSSTVIYTVQDIKDACKKYLASRDENQLAVNFAFYMTEPCVMFHFLSKFTFDDYKAYVKSMVANMTNMLNSDVIQKFADFDNMSLNIVEGVILRKSDNEGLEAYSFERVLMKLTIMFANQNPDAGIIVPYMDELICPKNILFLDVDQISKASNTKLNKLFGDIKDGLKTKYKPISLKKISKLSAIATNKRRLKNQLANHQKMMANQTLGKRKIFRFRKVAMTKNQLSQKIRKIVEKEVNVSASENYAKIIKSSYLRANRRKPDDYNLQGKSISMQYKPDIHIYLDTSGSISEDNYKNAILTLITLAKKLDVNLYFNSFSHEISKCKKLRIKGKTVNGIYKEFQKVPKVTGGTDYKKVWDYIMGTPKRKKEISLMITDFEYYPPSKRVNHPPKLYYVPIDISSAYWRNMISEAETFCQSMYHIDGNIRKKILL